MQKLCCHFSVSAFFKFLCTYFVLYDNFLTFFLRCDLKNYVCLVIHQNLCLALLLHLLVGGEPTFFENMMEPCRRAAIMKCALYL